MIAPDPAQERVLLTCTPDRTKPEHQLLLTEHHLQVLWGATAVVYQLGAISGLAVKHIKVMGLYLGGGLLALGSLLALTNNILHPLAGVVACMTGAAMFYYGLKGKISLTVFLPDEPETFWLSGELPELQKFAAQSNFYLQQYHRPPPAAANEGEAGT